MNFLMNDSIIKAISWTLIHSLWLGLAAAFVAALIIWTTKKASSAIRYNLLAGLSVLFLVTVGFVFCMEYGAPTSDLQVNQAMKSDLQMAHPASVSNVIANEEGSAPLSTIAAFISNYGSWIVFSWLFVFIFKCIRMTGDLRQVYHARNYQTITPPEMWLQRLSELQISLRIKRRIQLLESRLVTIPSVTGFFKPIILVPVGMLSNIPQDQVEAILLHELAHIRRSDYAVNLLQTFIEILFFFNPGILWISSLLKDERENCCDDLAISVTNNKREFVNALVSFQEYNMNAHRFSLQFSDQKMKLADRAKRILFNTNKALSNREKYFLSACVAMGLVLLLVVFNVNSSTAQEIKSSAGPRSAKKIASEKIIEYVSDDSLDVDISEEDRLIDEASAIIDIHSAIIDKHSAEIDKHSAIIDQQAKILNAEMNKKSGKINWEKYNEAQRRIEEEQAKIQAESDKIDYEARQIDEQSRKIDEQARKIDTKLKLQEQERLADLSTLQAGEDITQTVIDELKAAGYKGKIHSFELNEKALIINGKNQSESLFNTVKTHIKPGMRILYHIDTH